MQRYFIRFFIALATFVVGVFVTAVPGLFHHAGNRPTAVGRIQFGECPHSRRRVVVPSPAMSIENSTEQPVKLLYSSTSIDPADPSKRQVHVVVENTGSIDIQTYTISYRSTWNSNMHGGGGRVLVGGLEGNILRVGQSQTVAISCDDDQALTLWFDHAEFVNGSSWSNAQHIR